MDVDEKKYLLWVPIEAIRQGDRLIIRKGEVVPVDGHVANGVAMLDLSALTGESLPKTLARGAEVLSGAVLVGSPFDLIASRPASDSTYAGVVRLVRAAQASKASVRTAVLDKTGTLTQGRPSIIAIRTTNRFTEADVLASAASLDQASAYVVAAS